MVRIFLIHKISEKEVTYLFKVLEYQYENGSTIICPQLEPTEWHKHLGSQILLPHSYTLGNLRKFHARKRRKIILKRR